MKRFFDIALKPLALFTLIMFVAGCDTGEVTKDNPPDLHITEEGVRGSWTHSEDNVLPVLAVQWFIEAGRTTIRNVCDFGNRTVKASITVESTLDGDILTLNQTDNDVIEDGGKVCSVSATEGTKYALTLVTNNNTLRISRNGTTTEFHRIHPVVNNHKDEDQEDVP